MGSRKRLVLASLVGLMMALAFVIGLMPSHGALRASAATGRVDMVDLLNAVLNLQAGEPATEIAVTFPEEGLSYLVPDNTLRVYLNTQAAAEGNASRVAYAVDPDLTEGEGIEVPYDLPPGTDFAFGSHAPHYNAVLGLAPMILDPTVTAMSVYAFANAAYEKIDEATLVYSVRSQPTNFTITKVDQEIYDPDRNGLPAPLTAVIQANEHWRASYMFWLYDESGAIIDAGFCNVAIANLNGAAPVKQPYGLGVTVSPEPGVFVTSPTFDQLFAAGLMYEDELGYLIVNSSLDLQLAVRDVYGLGNTPGDIATWAAGVEAVSPPGGKVLWNLPGPGEPSPFVEISLLAVDTVADTYREVETLPDTLPVVLELEEMDVDGTAPVQLWSYQSWIRDTAPGDLDFYFASVQAAAGVYEWQYIDQQNPQPGDTFIAELTSLSIFAAFESAMRIDTIYPDSASTCTEPGEVHIVGTFGYVPGTSVEDLEARYDVFFGDQLASIIAATLLYDGFVVEAPPSSIPQMVDVTVVDTEVAANVAVLEQGFEYYDIFTLELVQAAGGTIEATPLEASYATGDVVNLVATANANYTFVEWQGDVGDVADIADETTTLTFGRGENDTCDDLSAVITAQFQYNPPIPAYFLIVNVAPAGAGVVNLDGNQQALGVVLGPFTPGDSVDLNAIAENCYEFADWDGPVDSPASAATSLTFAGFDATIEVTANFVPTCYTLTVVEDPDEGGDVTVNPDQLQYEVDDSVTLTAIPNTAIEPSYRFVEWIINESDVRLENPLTLDFADFAVRDVMVRAVFRQNPVLTILDTEGGSVDVTSDPPSVDEIPAFPNRAIEFLPNTEVTLEAVAAANFEFVQWEGDIAEADRFNAIVTFTIEENRTVRAIFTSTNFLITDITPDHAWFFGGVVANIRGTGFMPGSSQLRVYGAPVTPLEVTATDIWFVVPPLPVAPPSQSLGVNVTVSNPPFTEEFAETIDFLYLRYATSGNITTTAFRYMGSTADIAVALNGDLSQASLLLPPPEQAVPQAYGLIRATTQPALIEADEISLNLPAAKEWEFADQQYDGAPIDVKYNTGAGLPVANSWNFAIHLYTPAIRDVGLNTGAAVHAEIDDWTYERDEATIPAQLEFPVGATGLDAAAIRNDVMMWSVDTRYEYGLDVTTLVSPLFTQYQSTLEQLEVTPIVTPDSPALATTPITSVVTRLYDLTAFALQVSVPVLPAEFVDAMEVDAPGGTVAGPTSGGTQFTVNAPLGGLAWVTVGFGENITETTPASATQRGVVIDNGATEFSAIIQAPKWPTDVNTTVDVAIYLNSNLNEPLIIFENAFRYEAEGGCNFSVELLLLLLGLAAALIGLAAGGDSGGGGGGPCFIATAAYGTPMAADIDTLRAVRDAYLLESSVGTAFVDAYYHVSPAIAGVIAQSPALAAMVRLLLLPVIFVAKLVLAMPAVTLLAVGVAMVLARIRRRSKAEA